MIKTRIAPSPTGEPHVGLIRTMIYAYLTAKHENGIFYLRIEDTDQTRKVEGAADRFLEVMSWLDITPDEGFMGSDDTQPHGYKEIGDSGPYVQSYRKNIYKKYAEELVEKGHAYYCFCSKERLDELRENQTASKQPTMYDRYCRNLSPEEVKAKLEAGTPYVIRQKIPLDQFIITSDLVRKKQKISTNVLDDGVLLKADGHATYHLAHIVDDHLMGTTHVIRGEEWLPSLPKHLLLFKQMGWEAPLYAHLPQVMIIDSETGTKRKFSKRKGDPTFTDLIAMGYLPAAVFNFLTFIGWNPGKGETKEIFSKEELIKIFELSNVQKAGGLFDINKLDWMNGQYLRSMDNELLLDYLLDYLQKYRPESEYDTIATKVAENRQLILDILEQVKQKMRTISEFYEQTKIFWEWSPPSADIIVNEKMKVDTLDIALKGLNKLLDMFEGYQGDWTLEKITAEIGKVRDELGYKNGQILWPLRATLSGTLSSPGAFEMAYILGKEENIKRIKESLKKI